MLLFTPLDSFKQALEHANCTVSWLSVGTFPSVAVSLCPQTFSHIWSSVPHLPPFVTINLSFITMLTIRTQGLGSFFQPRPLLTALASL